MEIMNVLQYNVDEKKIIVRNYTWYSEQSVRSVPLSVFVFAYGLGSVSFLLPIGWLPSLLICIPVYCLGTFALIVYLDFKKSQDYAIAYRAICLCNIVLSIFLLESGGLILFATNSFFHQPARAVIFMYVVYAIYTVTLFFSYKQRKKNYWTYLLSNINDKTTKAKTLIGGVGFTLIGYLIGQFFIGFGLQQFVAVICVVGGCVMARSYLVNIILNSVHYNDIIVIKQELDIDDTE